ncbi:MAG TPA: hypothetical protein VHB02_05960 [Acidimicrobiales bacterium]|nr:hypothetical protein [Acidimicrobiales bacterium]
MAIQPLQVVTAKGAATTGTSVSATVTFPTAVPAGATIVLCLQYKGTNRINGTPTYSTGVWSRLINRASTTTNASNTQVSEWANMGGLAAGSSITVTAAWGSTQAIMRIGIVAYVLSGAVAVGATGSIRHTSLATTQNFPAFVTTTRTMFVIGVAGLGTLGNAYTFSTASMLGWTVHSQSDGVGGAAIGTICGVIGPNVSLSTVPITWSAASSISNMAAVAFVPAVAAGTSTDGGTGSEGPPSIRLGGADAGHGAEGDGIDGTLSAAEVGVADDGAALQMAVGTSDGGAGLDYATPSVSLGAGEAGSGADSAALQAAIVVLDAGASLDLAQILAAMGDVDAGASVDAELVVQWRPGLVLVGRPQQLVFMGPEVSS